MENSKKYTEAHGGDFIRFEENVPVTVKLLKDKEVKIKDTFKGGELDGMRYLVELPGGENTTFQTAGITLISALAKCNEGDTVTITKVKRGVKTVYEVKKGDEDISMGVDGEPAVGEAPAEGEW
jgi:hypothetical protein